jgi:prevent-host-death family protein
MIYLTFSVREEWRMPRRVSAAQVKAQFADCLRSAERGDSVLITRHGKPVAALVPATELEQLERLRAAGPEKGLAAIAGGWKGSEELVRAVGRVRRTGPRRTARLD